MIVTPFHAAVIVAAGSVVAAGGDRVPARRRPVDRPSSSPATRLRDRCRAPLGRRSLVGSARIRSDRHGPTLPPDGRAGIVIAGGAIGAVAAAATSGPTLAPLGALVMAASTTSWRRRSARRRVDAAVAQLADLVRFLANATEAGLSLRGALTRAGSAVPAPLGSMVARVAFDLELGAPLADALVDLTSRLPGPEARFLVSTLVVQQRSGGDVVSALRRMAVSLGERAAVRAEMQTLLHSASASANAVVALGVGALGLTVAAGDGVWDDMTSSTVGQLAIVAATSLYAVGHWLIGRISRVDR